MFINDFITVSLFITGFITVSLFSDELDLIQTAAKKCNLISELSAHLNLPNFEELQTMEKSTHIMLYMFDMWGFIVANRGEKNIQNFMTFLLHSRRSHISIIFEFHAFPWNLHKDLTSIFTLYLANSTLIFLTRNISDQSKLKTFLNRFLSGHIDKFNEAQKLSQNIIALAPTNTQRSYVCLQKDISQKNRLLRVDMFGENIILLLD